MNKIILFERKSLAPACNTFGYRNAKKALEKSQKKFQRKFYKFASNDV